MSRIKAIFAGLLVMTILAALFACGEQEEKPKDERITVKLAAPQNAYIQNFDTNSYKLWLEKKSGLKIEMNWLPSEDAERIAMLALGTGIDLPDAYVGFGSYNIFSNLNLQKYGECGAILSLEDLVEQNGQNLKEIWNELSEYDIKQFMTFAQGHIYYMPGFSSSIITRYRQVMWVNRGWLEELNFPVPKTTEEFRDMLMAFKKNYPESIPLAGTEDHYGKQVYDFLFNSFIYNDEKHDRLILENGLVKFAPVREQWREALRYMRGLYQDGLMSPLSFTQNNQQHIQIANESHDVLGAFTSPGITLTAQQNSPDVMNRYFGIGPLTGPGGLSFASVSVPLPKPNGVITSACKHPEEVFKLFDLMLSEEACLIGRYGEQDVDWELAKEGDISIYGTPATIRIINQIWNKTQNKHLSQIVPYVSRPRFSGGVTWDGNHTDGEYMNAQAAMLYIDHEPNEFIGELIFTMEEEDRILDIRNNINEYIKQNIIDFISGNRDIDNDAEWAAYIREFEFLGLETLIDTNQTALNRMKKD